MSVLVGEVAGTDGSWAAVGIGSGGVWIQGDLTLSSEGQEEFAQVYARACWLGEQNSIMDQPVTTDATVEPQPCYVCHTLVPPIYDGGVPFYVCPPSQAMECLDRAKALRAEMGTETAPEET